MVQISSRCLFWGQSYIFPNKTEEMRDCGCSFLLDIFQRVILIFILWSILGPFSTKKELGAFFFISFKMYPCLDVLVALEYKPIETQPQYTWLNLTFLALDCV